MWQQDLFLVPRDRVVAFLIPISSLSFGVDWHVELTAHIPGE
jgi:hypothetical protein